MECILWEGIPILGYFGYSWDEDSLLDHRAPGNCHAQQASPCPRYKTVPHATMELVTPWMAQHDSGTSTPLLVGTLLDSENGNTP